jgi:AbrB family looped-hinge helix DNA binding protein
MVLGELLLLLSVGVLGRVRWFSENTTKKYKLDSYSSRNMSMINEVRRVGTKGQVVIPKSFRDALGIKAGEDINMTIEDDKVIIERQAHDIKQRLQQISKHAEGEIQSSDEAYEAMRQERWTKST